MLCRWLQIKKIYQKRNYGSLQTNKNMSPPAFYDTSSGRVSSCTSLGKGSFTVEAAFIVPMFFLVMIMLLCMLDMIRVQSSITLSLNESAKYLGMYVYESEKMLGDSPIQAMETGACAAYAQARLPKIERVSVSLLGSSYQKHIVDLKAKVLYRFPIRFAGIEKAVFYCSARVHAWTGYREAEDGNFSGTEEKMVYITESQTVYHTHGDCSHLQLSIQGVSGSSIAERRNANGAKYQACPYCKPDSGDTVLYLTLYGDRYHSKAGCQALKRTGRLVPESAAAHLKECSRCAQRR